MKQAMTSMGRAAGTGMLGLFVLLSSFSASAPVHSAGLLVLDDYSSKDTAGFPTAWKAQRQETKARTQYTVHTEKGMTFLRFGPDHHCGRSMGQCGQIPR